MGGLDKAMRCNALVESGWKEISENQLVPPDDLWENKPESFHVYDAIELHGILGAPEKMSDELKRLCGLDDG